MTQTKASAKAETVKVIIRCRPMDEKELQAHHNRVVEMDVKRGSIELVNPKAGSGEIPKRFTFDAVYDWDSKQKDLYDESFRPLVDSVLEGFNGTIFAYGQTGTGKTFTMQGVKDDEELRGVIPNSFDHIFSHIARQENKQYLVRASYLEIYKEDVRDLLHKDQSKRLEIREKPDTGVYVKDLSSVLTKSIKEIEKVMNIGNQNRSVGSTNMNEHSSRSHAIFIVTVECSELGMDGENHIRVGKLNMVDLAGSERQTKTGAEGERLKEATKINLSLSALGNVISALVDSNVAHVPYRDSKLTRLLQDSLGGNAKTVMVANIGPASYNYDETLNTLRYANRAKNIKNKPKINEDPKDALLREYQNEINRLKAMLSGEAPKKSVRKKRKRRRKCQRTLPDGTVEEYSEEEEVEDGENEEESFLKEQQEKLEKEKEAILNNQNLIAEEKERFLQEVHDRESQLKLENQKNEALQMKIKTMESKLLCGGKNIVDHTNEQQRALDKRRQEIAEQKRLEREIMKEMEAKEETMMALQGDYSSLQEEVDIKTKKLKKLFQKLQLIKQEVNDVQEEHIRSRQDLERTQEELTRELKLKLLIIENFIPTEEKEKIVSRVFFDEENDTWRLVPLSKAGPVGATGDESSSSGTTGPSGMAKRPTSAIGGRRPMSEFSRLACTMGPNPRYKGENILVLELDLPNRTTRVYEPPAMAPQLAAALETALQDEEDIEMDGSPTIFKPNAPMHGKKRRDQRRLRSARPEHEFPTSRGLVPK